MTLIVAGWNRYSVLLCSTLVTVSHILRSLAVTNCARSYTINTALILAVFALTVSLASFVQYMHRLKMKIKRKVKSEQKFLSVNISVDESIAILTQIISVLYCFELIIRSSQYGPFCARHLSPELASGWTYASSLLFFILCLGNSRFQVKQVISYKSVVYNEVENLLEKDHLPLHSTSCEF